MGPLVLAHLSHRLRVGQCPSCVVRRQQFALNNISSETARPSALIFGMQHCLVDLYQVFSNDGPGVRNGPASGGGGSWVQKRNILQNLLLQNCLAQVLEIWYVTMPGGPLPSLFKPRSQGPRWPRAMGS